MNTQQNLPPAANRYRGPHPGIVAAVYVFLKVVSVMPVSGFGVPFGVTPPFFPALNAPAAEVSAYFSGHHLQVLYAAFLQFGTAIPFGIFTAAVAVKLRLATNGAAAVYIAMFSGFLVAFNEATSGAAMWVMAQPGIGQDQPLIQALHYLVVEFGGPGFTMPQGILMAAICVPAAFIKLLPKWMIVFGFALAVIGQLSWLSMVLPAANFLIPLCRWPGFVWLIVAGFKLAKFKPTA